MYLLFTGGRDSLLALYRLIEQGKNPTLFYIQAGKINSLTKRETVSVKYYASLFGLSYVIKRVRDIPATPSNGGYVPYRNLTLVSLAVQAAKIAGINFVCFPYTRNTDNSSCDSEHRFGELLRAMFSKINLRDRGKVHFGVEIVESPIADVKSANSLKELLRINADISACCYCLKAQTPCGKCKKCVAAHSSLNKQELECLYSHT
jgi:7-cyano-7-deazaguanine synthase in queuosine biosynthesis